MGEDSFRDWPKFGIGCTGIALMIVEGHMDEIMSEEGNEARLVIDEKFAPRVSGGAFPPVIPFEIQVFPD